MFDVAPGPIAAFLIVIAMKVNKVGPAPSGRRCGCSRERLCRSAAAILDWAVAIVNDAGTAIGKIAIARVTAKDSPPIIGPRAPAQLRESLGAKVMSSPGRSHASTK